MRVAVTYEKGEVFQHFGRTEQFKLYDIMDGKIEKEEIAGTNGSGHGALAGFLAELKVDVLICGGIGGGAKEALKEAGIELYGGVSGKTDDAVKAFLTGELQYDPDMQCSHHAHEHEQHEDCHGSHGGCHGGQCHSI